MFVKDWMQAPATLLIADVPIGTALRHLERVGASHVVVIHHGAVVGLHSRGELRRALPEGNDYVLRPHRYLGDLDAGEIPPLHPMDPIEQAARVMTSCHASALPVMEEGRVLGLLNAGDVVRACAEILGAGEGGARVLLSGRKESDLLDSISRRSHGLIIRSLAAHRKAGGGWEAVLRVRGRVPGPLSGDAEQCA